MPGGSVNGRPFRESVDSYSRTGIPCGNPRRYQSHDVVRMEAGARSRSRIVDGPLETIETEGQKQLQSMLQKQMETKVTMQQQLGQKREFTQGAEYLASSEELTGTRNLSDFIALGEVDKYIEEMKNYGLTHEEILYKVQMENEGSMKKSKFSNPDYNVSRMAEIDEKIAQKKQALSKPDSFSNAKSLSRHEMELENAIATANTQNRFLHKNLVKERENQSGSNPNDPMNCIPEILEKFSKSKHSDTKKQKKKDKKTDKKECMLECCNSSMVSNCAECSRRKIENTETESEACSLCDTSCHQSCDHEMEIQTCAEKPADYVSKEEITGNKAKSEKKLPQKSTSFTVKTLTDKTVSEETVVNSNTKDEEEGVADKSNSSKEQNVENVRELENVEAIPEDVIRRYKLSADEVKKLPRFETYTPGEPSNVLFVKNLAPKVTEQDLAALFIQFQDDDSNRIVFKLLNGRMKGQAFVTFSSTEKASQALELVHGYDFKGKPVIVQFGRKSS
ncbi:RNA-binding protein 41-like isoform X2 [Mercenaria mercenaria]|uniref:RNA-binding protein 41-like isoform X2 n=1 Tax=Mercenaria mercenaria TaxID=6596 RepID=UPI00234FB423|nr:RNA-binding protein 41-like isoform X2 [Mercenaria mercenaria]